MEKQADKLRHISSKYEHDKKVWATALNNLENRIKVTMVVQRYKFPFHVLNWFPIYSSSIFYADDET